MNIKQINSYQDLSNFVSRELDATRTMLLIDYDADEVDLVPRGQPPGHWDAGRFIKHKSVVFVDLSSFINSTQGLINFLQETVDSWWVKQKYWCENCGNEITIENYLRHGDKICNFPPLYSRVPSRKGSWDNLVVVGNISYSAFKKLHNIN